MSLVIHCRICKDIIPTTDLRRKICNKTECQLEQYRGEKRLYAMQHRIKINHTHCQNCGNEIPVGEYRSKYCKPECSQKGKTDRRKELKQLKRDLLQNKPVTGVSAVSLCSTVEPTVPTPPLRSGGMLYG